MDTVVKYVGVIKEYIRNQLQEGKDNDQISIKEYIHLFTGEQEK